MGTQGAYGGSAGWSDTRRDTEEWLDSGPGNGGNGAQDRGGNDDEATPGELSPSPDADRPQPTPQIIDPHAARILAGVARHLAAAVSGSSSRPDGGGGHGGTGSGTGGGGGRRGRAAAAGGVAVAGVYGLRSGSAAAVADAGLSLADLDGLSPFAQAQRLVEAASGPSALIEQDEIREVNANFMWWAIQQDQPPAPSELVKAWVTEFVYRTWLTEAGSVLRDGTRDGASTHAFEREVRVTLEAAVTRVDLPTEGLRATDFQAAIIQLLETLERIFGEAAA